MQNFIHSIFNSRFKTTAAVFFASAVVMLIFEATKEFYLNGLLTSWESHTITIIFTACIASIIAGLVANNLRIIFEQRKNLELREKAIETHKATMSATSHYINNSLNMLSLIKMRLEKGRTIEEKTLVQIEENLLKSQREILELGLLEDPTKERIEHFVKSRL